MSALGVSNVFPSAALVQIRFLIYWGDFRVRSLAENALEMYVVGRTGSFRLSKAFILASTDFTKPFNKNSSNHNNQLIARLITTAMIDECLHVTVSIKERSPWAATSAPEFSSKSPKAVGKVS